MLRIHALLIVLVCCAFTACNGKIRRVTDVRSEMTRLIQAHRFDEAAQLGLRSVTGSTSDAPIFYLVSLAYAERAQYDADLRVVSLKQVDDYARKSVSADSSNQLNRFDVAWVLEYAASIDAGTQCQFYRQSGALYEQISNSLSSAANTTEANVSGSDRLRNEAAKGKSRVHKKQADADCQ